VSREFSEARGGRVLARRPRAPLPAVVPSSGARTRPQQSPRWECTAQRSVPCFVWPEPTRIFSHLSPNPLRELLSSSICVFTTQDSRDPAQSGSSLPDAWGRPAVDPRPETSVQPTRGLRREPCVQVRSRIRLLRYLRSAVQSPPLSCSESLPCDFHTPAAVLLQRQRISWVPYYGNELPYN
jgi:hypothetical protein